MEKGAKRCDRKRAMVEVNVASDSSVSEEGEEVQTIVTDSHRSLEENLRNLVCESSLAMYLMILLT